jgi:prolyl-tRNA editing enzyme YbaK/EbsC (Cys-tRNA(Pro) deacylase)
MTDISDPERLPASAAKVRETLRALGHEARVVVFGESTRTSADAAEAIGCEVGQIAKSLVFRAKAADRPVLVIASGTNRVNEKAVAALLADRIGDGGIIRADAGFVRARTGFAIGGVPPVGHADPPVVAIDEDLMAYPTVWAAAGTPNAVFEIAPADLAALTGGRVGALAG